MTPVQQLDAARHIFLDTAPVIYFVEANPRYLAVVEPIFSRIDAGSLLAASSPVTLAECLVHPLRNGNAALADSFVSLLGEAGPTKFVYLDGTVAHLAAELRASHGLTLTDAFQLAAAATAGCDLFLTNDAALKRVQTPAVITLDDLLETAIIP